MAKKKIVKVVSNLLDKTGLKDVVTSSGKAMISNIKTTGAAEAYATALSLILDGKPKYTPIVGGANEGMFQFWWEGEELRKAQQRVLDITRHNPNAKMIVDYSGVVAPTLLRAVTPALVLGGLYLVLRSKK